MIFIILSNLCYIRYNETGCGECVASEPMEECGLCLTTMTCMEGSVVGPDSGECSSWLFNEMYCIPDPCIGKGVSDCIHPCEWINNQCERESKTYRKILLGWSLFIAAGLIIFLTVMCIIDRTEIDDRPIIHLDRIPPPTYMRI